MERISLYRKWRPRAFTEVVGQPHVTKTLANALSSGRLVHAYLFCGPRGTGKTSTARILAKAINCEQGPTAVPCNECEACISISEGTALDVIEIDAASNRKIDEIRDLLDKIPYTPTSLRTKVYIIDEVHQLTPEASSALLKTLEEPPGHVVFVLATTESHKILPTIVSRCQRFDFSLVPTQEISALLTDIASHENIEIEPEALALVAEHAHGSVRDAIGVMDQISNLAGEMVTQVEVAGLLGEVETGLVFEMIDVVSERDTAAALSLAGRMVDSGKDPRRFVESLIAHLRALFLIQNAANPREIVEATDEHFARLTEQAGKMKRYEVVRLIERLGDCHRDMRFSENPRLVLETALVKATRRDVDVTVEGLLFRIEELERKVAAAVAPGSESAPEPAPPLEAPRRRSRPEPPAPEESEPPAGPEAVPAGDPEEREKAKRAWMAVLAELKKQGQMRVYALLTKAKILGVEGDEIVLGFPADASFQMSVIEGSNELKKIEESWSHFMGSPVRLRLEKAGGQATRSAPAERTAPARKPQKRAAPAEKRAKEESDSRETGTAAPGKKASPGKKGGSPEERPGGSEEVAQMLKESFDGEIID